jgi:hypothetical protein
MNDAVVLLLVTINSLALCWLCDAVKKIGEKLDTKEYGE